MTEQGKASMRESPVNPCLIGGGNNAPPVLEGPPIFPMSRTDQQKTNTAAPSSRRPRRRRASLVGRCARKFFPRLGERGETMLEFAFVAPMLILLLLIVIDLGIMLMTQSLLNGAAQSAARLIRTGQIAEGGSITTFQTQLCAGMSPIMTTATCQSNLLFEVNCYSSKPTAGCSTTSLGFSAVSFTSCTYNNNATGTGTQCAFNPGAEFDVVGVRVVYNRRFIVPWVGACLTTGSCWFGAGSRGPAGGSGNAVPLIATVIFQNEPFPSS